MPTIGIVIATDAGDLRELLLLLGAVGDADRRLASRQQAPVVVGAVVTAIAAMHSLSRSARGWSWSRWA